MTDPTQAERDAKRLRELGRQARADFVAHLQARDHSPLELAPARVSWPRRVYRRIRRRDPHQPQDTLTAMGLPRDH